MHGSNKLFTSVAGCQCQDHSIDHSSSSSSSIMLMDEGETVSSKNEEKNHEWNNEEKPTRKQRVLTRLVFVELDNGGVAQSCPPAEHAGDSLKTAFHQWTTSYVCGSLTNTGTRKNLLNFLKKRRSIPSPQINISDYNLIANCLKGQKSVWRPGEKFNQVNLLKIL